MILLKGGFICIANESSASIRVRACVSDCFAEHLPLRRVHLAEIETPPAALSEIINQGHMCLQ